MGAAKAAEEAEILCVSPTKEGNIIYVVGDGQVHTKDIERNLKAYGFTPVLWQHTIHGKKKREKIVIGLVNG